MLTQILHDLGKPRILLDIADDQRSLVLPDPARRDVVHGQCRARLRLAADRVRCEAIAFATLSNVRHRSTAGSAVSFMLLLQ